MRLTALLFEEYGNYLFYFFLRFQHEKKYILFFGECLVVTAIAACNCVTPFGNGRKIIIRSHEEFFVDQ